MYPSERGVEYYLCTVYLDRNLACCGLPVHVPTLPLPRIPVYVLPVVMAWSAHPQFDSGQ